MNRTFREHINDWLNESINFGGEVMTRTQVYQWFQDKGFPSRAADLWLLGYEHLHPSGIAFMPKNKG